MAAFFQRQFNILVQRRRFFTVSVLLFVACLGITALRGVSLGSDIAGGTALIITDTGDSVTIEDVRSALRSAGIRNATVWTTADPISNRYGFIATVPNASVGDPGDLYDRVALNLKLQPEQIESMAIGSTWKSSDGFSLLVTLLVTILAALIYTTIRRGYKASVSTLIAFTHAIALTMGIYLACGFLLTANSLTAMVAIIIYTAYNTMLVLLKITENMENTNRHSLMTIANHSVNQLLVKTLTTTLVILVLLSTVFLFGGAALSDMLLILIIGVIISPCSALLIAAPVYVVYRQREEKYARLLERYGEGVDEFTVAEQVGVL
jgi:SecD/SecF fusion protein